VTHRSSFLTHTPVIARNSLVRVARRQVAVGRAKRRVRFLSALAVLELKEHLRFRDMKHLLLGLQRVFLLLLFFFS